MSYQRYQISTTPPPMLSSDVYLTSSYNPYFSHEPRIQIAGQQPVIMPQQQVMIPQQVPQQQMVMPQQIPQQQMVIPQQVPQQQMVMPQQVPQQQMPQIVAVPIQTQSVPMAHPVAHSEPKGWTIFNMILCLLLLCSCVALIINLINGQFLNTIAPLVCLCIICSIYSHYNGSDEQTTH